MLTKPIRFELQQHSDMNKGKHTCSSSSLFSNPPFVSSNSVSFPTFVAFNNEMLVSFLMFSFALCSLLAFGYFVIAGAPTLLIYIARSLPWNEHS